MKIQSATLINAGHDINGNPLRAYIINEINLDDIQPYQYIIDVIDQGYLGSDAATKPYPSCLLNGYQINVSKKEYKDFLKIGKAKREGKAAR